MASAAVAIDGVFRALADPTRRQVLERLGRSPGSVSELAAPFEMALPSFLEHLRMLEGCGLVRSKKTGRVRTYQLVRCFACRWPRTGWRSSAPGGSAGWINWTPICWN